MRMLSEGGAPSCGIFCTKSSIHRARVQSESSSRPSTRTTPPGIRTATTCLRDGGTTRPAFWAAAYGAHISTRQPRRPRIGGTQSNDPPHLPPPGTASRFRVMTPILRAVVTTVVPDAATLDTAAWTEIDTIISGQLAQRPRALRRQLAVLLRLVDWLPLLRYGRRFTTLDAARRTRVLAALERAPALLLRRGIWGLRTLALLGYYGRTAAAAEIGYRGDPRGWRGRQ